MHKQYIVLAYYHFVTLENPHEEVTKHKKFFENRECTGRIYLSEEGINGQMSALIEDAEAYMTWLKSDPRFASVAFKIHSSLEQIFPRMTVKYRPQLVALDQKVDDIEGAKHVSPSQWREMLESGEYLVLDVRNQYEWEIGHFEGATLPPLETFREFPHYAEQLSHQVDPATPIMMYCTGGIRCELYSKVLKKQGFKHLFQLEGGVIGYGLQEGKKHWRGKLFVFDDRLAIPIDGEPCDPITQCSHCHTADDTYYNCANMDCNALFLCCSSCLEIYLGCCSFECKGAARVRPMEQKKGNKPFRKKHLIGCSLKNPKSVVVSTELPESDPV